MALDLSMVAYLPRSDLDGEEGFAEIVCEARRSASVNYEHPALASGCAHTCLRCVLPEDLFVRLAIEPGAQTEAYFLALPRLDDGLVGLGEQTTLHIGLPLVEIGRVQV